MPEEQARGAVGAHPPPAGADRDGDREPGPRALGERGRRGRPRVAGDRLPLLPDAEPADRHDHGLQPGAGAPVELAVARRRRAPARALREDLSALQGIRAADARGAAAGPRARRARPRGPAQGSAVPARVSPGDPRERRAAAGEDARQGAVPQADAGAFGDLRHRALRGAEGHLGAHVARRRGDLALDGRCADRRRPG